MDTKSRASKKDDMVAQCIILMLVFVIVMVIVTVLLCERFGAYGLLFPAVVIIALIIYSNVRTNSLKMKCEN